jgi:hypothetical protein
MRVRWIGVTLALALVGAAAGWAVGDATRDEPATFALPSPVAAVDPSWPAEPVPVLPDPQFPALGTDLRTHLETVGIPPFGLRLPIPDTWVRSNPTAGEWRWYPNPQTQKNVYFLRARLVGNRYQSIQAARDERLNALRDAADVADLDVELTTANGFRATYVSDGHRRVTMERFLGAADGTTYAWIALIGREVDRTGMDELFPRVTEGATP